MENRLYFEVIIFCYAQYVLIGSQYEWQINLKISGGLLWIFGMYVDVSWIRYFVFHKCHDSSHIDRYARTPAIHTIGDAGHGAVCFNSSDFVHKRW